MSDDLLTDSINRAVESMAERMEYELRGAWRAGYDYVHVYEDMPGVAYEDASEITLRRYVVPSNVEHAPRPAELVYLHTYDLGSVPDDVLREAIRNGNGGQS